MIALYPKATVFPVYDSVAWWSDRWDPLSFGRSFDFARPFFAQFAELQKVVPRLGMLMTNDEGSAYCSFCTHTKRCYLCSSCVVNEESMYCYQANDSRDCVDCNNITKSELCYECLHCFSLYSSAYCKDCENGSNLFACYDCRGCHDCIGCKNLVSKQYCILNEQRTKEEVLEMRKELQSFQHMQSLLDRFTQLALTLPSRASHLTNCENCSGDHLRDSRNSVHCFDAVNLEDCAYLCPIPQGAKDVRDAHYSPSTELLYEVMSGTRSNRVRFALHTWDSEDCLYTDECFSCRNLFGCIGLHHMQYCILNKQYSKDEYEARIPRILEHMRKSLEWGEFFPISSSVFGYNESIAADEFSLQKEEAQQRGWKWTTIVDDVPKVQRTIAAMSLPESITEIPDDILQWAVESAVSRRPFRIIKPELDFYRRMLLPIPRLHPEERYHRRVSLRNPRKLWSRKCQKCGKGIETTYSLDRPEKVYCEECYLKSVY